MTGVEAERRPTPYLRLARECPEYSWWRMPTGLFAGFGLYLALVIAAGVLTFAVFVATPPPDGFLEGLEASELSTEDPGLLGLLLLSVALWLPCQLLGRYVCGPRLGDLMSVEGRLRVRWLLVCSVLAFAVYGVLIGIAAVVDSDPSPVDVDRTTWAVIAVSLLIVPFQAAAEEVVFRGQLMQMVGAWTRWAWVPVVVSTPLFVAGHGYEFWGLVDVGVFGLTAAYLTIRTGGLEAAIAAHTANNVVLLSLESAGIFAQPPESYSAIDVLPTVVSSVLISLLVEVAFRRAGLSRTRPRLPDPPARVRVVYPMYPYPPQAYGYPPHHRPYPYGVPHQPPVPVGPAPLRDDYPDYPGEIADDWGRD